MKYLCPLTPRPDWCSNQCEDPEETESSDPQKIRLYCYEESLADHIKDRTIISLAECRKIVEDICVQYSVVEIPEVKDGRGMKVARGGYGTDKVLRIKLPCQYRYRIAVLHETAHCVLHYYLDHPKTRPPEETQRIKYYLINKHDSFYYPHGPLYVRYLLDIYSSYLKLDLAYLEMVAKQFSLDF